MKIQVTIHLIPRYGKQPTISEAVELHKKAEEWARKIMLENNSIGKHLSLHFNMEIVDIFRVDNPNMIVDDDYYFDRSGDR